MSNFSIDALQHKINTKTKPLGSLGILEKLALQIGTVQQTLLPQVVQPHIVVFAADHGIAAAGLVNPFPQAVTAQMVYNFCAGGAAINAFCKVNDCSLTVVDCGVKTVFDTSLPITHSKIAMGTANYLEGKAMSEPQVQQAMQIGVQAVEQAYQKGTNVIGFGEMGIGNTSAASLLMSAILGLPVQDCVGRGTGVNDSQLTTKLATLEKVYQLHQLSLPSAQPLALLQAVGGFEIAAMVGAFLHAYKLQMVFLVDGFIATSAYLIAQLIEPAIVANAVFAHCSQEQGHTTMLHHLHATPLLQLQMRLGEGTGAAMAIPILRAACSFVNEMASFESAGVSTGT
ncbi:MAG: nicotinate-nucleotide--dimethylbenzimidazole phosphoribosyltransferase [Bacteroidetes bacterium]|nr:MAG: nicotinate-nucleotide--dimethylbenzimidazole phosphoribosyltransferase [Bacteroidota bacterium]TAF92252.1 MAG: nicotinate-nucleotide--dimethylbenzimidazole phosphoribosyltransferase [Bacteroidota bacterium]